MSLHKSGKGGTQTGFVINYVYTHMDACLHTWLRSDGVVCRELLLFLLFLMASHYLRGLNSYQKQENMLTNLLVSKFQNVVSVNIIKDFFLLGSAVCLFAAVVWLCLVSADLCFFVLNENLPEGLRRKLSQRVAVHISGFQTQAEKFSTLGESF